MSRVRFSSHSPTFMFIQTLRHMRQSQAEAEGEQLGLKKDLTFSFHQPAIVKPPFINSYKQFTK